MVRGQIHGGARVIEEGDWHNDPDPSQDLSTCLTAPENIKSWHEIEGFRNTEILIFDMQLFSLMVYIALCKLFVLFKKKCNTLEQV